MRTYINQNDAINAEIIEPLGEFVNDFDVEAIADETLTGIIIGNEYFITPREDVDFWDIVEAHAL